MIDREVFAVWMAAIAGRIGKVLERETTMVYYATLSPALDTESFEIAAKRVLARHEFNTWPAAAAFIKAAPSHLHLPDEGELAAQCTMKLLTAGAAPVTVAPETYEAFRAQLVDELGPPPSHDENPPPEISDPDVIAERARRKAVYQSRQRATNPAPEEAVCAP